MRVRLFFAAILLLFFQLVCYASIRPIVYTVNYPLAFFARHIAGPYIKVVLPHFKDDPAFWQPNRKTIFSYQTAAKIIINGANYAKWVKNY